LKYYESGKVDDESGNYSFLAFGIFFAALFAWPIIVYLEKSYRKRQKKAATRRAIRERVMQRAQPPTEPADETKAEPDPTPVEPRASPKPA
jgi:hypothetical protein